MLNVIALVVLSYREFDVLNSTGHARLINQQARRLLYVFK